MIHSGGCTRQEPFNAKVGSTGESSFEVRTPLVTKCQKITAFSVGAPRAARVAPGTQETHKLCAGDDSWAVWVLSDAKRATLRA